MVIWQFCKEIDALGLIRKTGYRTIHIAARNGHTECLEFLVSRLELNV